MSQTSTGGEPAPAPSPGPAAGLSGLVAPTWDTVAPGLARFSLKGADAINVYLLQDLLVDAGPPRQASVLIAALESRPPAAHAVTHGHFDHQGASSAVCVRFGIPLWCGEGERRALESGKLSELLPRRPMLKLLHRLVAGPAHPVSRALREGDEAGGFTVLETPGHTPGHIAFWRESDRVLVLGDVLFHRNPVTMRVGLREPFRMVTLDLALNRASARRLASLRPEVVCFGHGPPLRSPEMFQAFCATL